MSDMIEKFSYFKNKVISTKENSEKRVKQFSENFVANPAYEMEWANYIYQVSGRIQASNFVLSQISTIEKMGITKERCDLMFKVLQDEVNRMATSIAPNSSSASANLMKVYSLQAFAEFLEYKNLF